MVALGARTLAALAVPYPEQLHPFAPKLSGDGVTELFPAGRNDVLLFVKSSTAECADEATAAFVAVAGSVLEDIETTGAARCRTVRLVICWQTVFVVYNYGIRSARPYIMHGSC